MFVREIYKVTERLRYRKLTMASEGLATRELTFGTDYLKICEIANR